MGPVSAIDGHLVRTHFSAHAGDYDRYAVVQKQVVSDLAARLVASGPLSGLVLDIGTGTGALAAELGGSGSDCNFVLTDLAHGMTRAAAQRLPGTLPCDGDAMKLPFVNEVFTTVASSNVYQWIEDLPAAFREVSRVLCSGGRFAVALFGERTLFELRNAHRQAVTACDIDHPSHVQSFPSAAEVAAALDSAGFTRCDFTNFLKIEWHPDVPTLLRQLKRIGASNAAVDRPRGLASRQVMQKMMTIYEESHRRQHGIPATYEVVCAVAAKV